MADNKKKMVEQITSMDVDFAQWYTDVVKKAELVDYSGVKGCMIIRPYGYAIWENIQRELDARFKAPWQRKKWLNRSRAWTLILLSGTQTLLKRQNW